MSKESNLKALLNMAENIKEAATLLIEDINTITERDDLYIIESRFENIMRTAMDGCHTTRYAFDSSFWEE